MSAALARRDDGCISDLAMDRWLLGELAGCDEALRLEQHVDRCPGCAARLQALRSLYGNQPTPKAQEPLPPLSAPPPVLPPEHAVVLQVIILREGLLVGTEVFTAGRYFVGSAPACAMRLDELAPVHAAISLQGDRVALEASSAPVLVNGFRTQACELRPIDEVAVGPYVLRTRVIAERWRRPKLELVAEEEEPEPPAPRDHALKLELYWGDRCVEVKVIQRPEELREFGIQSVVPIDGGFSLDGLRVAHGDRARLHVGQLLCIASAVPGVAPVARRSPREWPWAVLSTAAVLTLCTAGLGLYAARLPPLEERFPPPRASTVQPPLRPLPPRYQGPATGAQPPAVLSDAHVWAARGSYVHMPGSTLAEREAVAGVIRAHLPEIGSCYEAAKFFDGLFDGRVIVDFRISPQGIVDASRVSQTDVPDELFTGCVVGKLNRLRFPRSDRPLEVTYPFYFSAAVQPQPY